MSLGVAIKRRHLVSRQPSFLLFSLGLLSIMSAWGLQKIKVENDEILLLSVLHMNT